MTELSNDEARRIALAAQGFAEKRPAGRVDVRHLRRVVSRTGLLQIDTVNTVVRSHYLPVFSRLGPYPMSLLEDAVYRRRELFETWAHAASIVPVEHYAALRARMEVDRFHRHYRKWAGENPDYVAQVLAEVRSNGPLVVGELDDAGPRGGTFWNWSKGKLALQWLFLSGQIMISQRPNFARAYDLAERVLPRTTLNAKIPPIDEAQKTLLLMAARYLGVATASDLADYYRLPMTASRAALRELTEEGTLEHVSVEGWRERAYLHPQARTPRGIRGRALVSPFDSLVWKRDRTERLFDFRYQLEIYLPQSKRTFGYYVLPFLLDGRLVARVDLKADRATSRLLAKGVFVEGGEDPQRVAAALAEELRDMAAWLGLDGIDVGRRGNLSSALRAALR